MAEGMDFNLACDQKDVFVGSEDADFIYSRYVLNAHSLSYENWYEVKCRNLLTDIKIII